MPEPQPPIPVVYFNFWVEISADGRTGQIFEYDGETKVGEPIKELEGLWSNNAYDQATIMAQLRSWCRAERVLRDGAAEHPADVSPPAFDLSQPEGTRFRDMRSPAAEKTNPLQSMSTPAPEPTRPELGQTPVVNADRLASQTPPAGEPLPPDTALDPNTGKPFERGKRPRKAPSKEK